MKLIPISERKGCRCWFCCTDKSVKYEAKIRLYTGCVHVMVCNKCVLTHNNEFIDENEEETK